ncbi:TPA: 30S ribosomal protein S17e [Candidatus Bathyarchaeota archaeon]|nr:30S ribosomal protein S17e [Candidatus Bathyarchaeota archaeon]
MGKVRTQVVKKVAKELLEKYPDAFTTSFEENKRAVEQLLEVDGKRLRNRIAGYVTNLKKIEERRVALAAAPA